MPEVQYRGLLMRPNPPLKTDISGLFDEDEDIEEFESSLFGDDDDDDS